jgi:hypothetical protein
MMLVLPTIRLNQDYHQHWYHTISLHYGPAVSSLYCGRLLPARLSFIIASPPLNAVVVGCLA